MAHTQGTHSPTSCWAFHFRAGALPPQRLRHQAHGQRAFLRSGRLEGLRSGSTFERRTALDELDNIPAVLHNQMASTDPVLKRIVVASDESGNINVQRPAGRTIPVCSYFADVVDALRAGGPDLRCGARQDNFAPRFGRHGVSGMTSCFRVGYGCHSTASSQGNSSESTGIVRTFPFSRG